MFTKKKQHPYYDLFNLLFMNMKITRKFVLFYVLYFSHNCLYYIILINLNWELSSSLFQINNNINGTENLFIKIYFSYFFSLPL